MRKQALILVALAGLMMTKCNACVNISGQHYECELEPGHLGQMHKNAVAQALWLSDVERNLLNRFSFIEEIRDLLKRFSFSGTVPRAALIKAFRDRGIGL